MIKVIKPQVSDLLKIKKILAQWTKKKEVDKYIGRITNEINGKIEYNMRFWVAKEKETPIGVIGVSDLLPKILPFTRTKKPGEIKILYVDKDNCNRGIGRKLVKFLEKEAVKRGYKELLVRSAKKYKETAYGFYEKMGYLRIGSVSGGEEKSLMQVFEKKLI